MRSIQAFHHLMSTGLSPTQRRIPGWPPEHSLSAFYAFNFTFFAASFPLLSLPDTTRLATFSSFEVLLKCCLLLMAP